MKRTARQGNEVEGSSTDQHGAKFRAVVDSRNRKVPGLHTRNGRYYGQLWVEREDGAKTARRFPLLDPDGQPVTGLSAAKEAMDLLRHTRRERKLPLPGRRPTFFAYVETYFRKAEVAAKKKETLEQERWKLEHWKAHLGDVSIDRKRPGILPLCATSGSAPAPRTAP